jgi:hypothetical protein
MGNSARQGCQLSLALGHHVTRASAHARSCAGRKKDDKAHDASMEGMRNACVIMFGSLSNLVQVSSGSTCGERNDAIHGMQMASVRCVDHATSARSSLACCRNMESADDRPPADAMQSRLFRLRVPSRSSTTALFAAVPATRQWMSRHTVRTTRHAFASTSCATTRCARAWEQACI